MPCRASAAASPRGEISSRARRLGPKEESNPHRRRPEASGSAATERDQIIMRSVRRLLGVAAREGQRVARRGQRERLESNVVLMTRVDTEVAPATHEAAA